MPCNACSNSSHNSKAISPHRVRVVEAARAVEVV